MDPEVHILAAIDYVEQLQELEGIQQYRETYLALLNLGAIVGGNPTNLALLQLGLAAYGWMPTIFKNVPNQQQLEAFSNLVQAGAPTEQVENSPLILKTFNNSVVGTSKVLHFMFPNTYPIWDSNIAIALGFGVNNQNAFNNSGNYIQFMNTLNNYLLQNPHFQAPQLINEHFAGVEVTQLRKLEICLFLYGKSIRLAGN